MKKHRQTEPARAQLVPRNPNTSWIRVVKSLPTHCDAHPAARKQTHPQPRGGSGSADRLLTDVGGSRVQAVLHQLLDGGAEAQDDLPGADAMHGPAVDGPDGLGGLRAAKREKGWGARGGLRGERRDPGGAGRAQQATTAAGPGTGRGRGRPPASPGTRRPKGPGPRSRSRSLTWAPPPPPSRPLSRPPPPRPRSPQEAPPPPAPAIGRRRKAPTNPIPSSPLPRQQLADRTAQSPPAPFSPRRHAD